MDKKWYHINVKDMFTTDGNQDINDIEENYQFKN